MSIVIWNCSNVMEWPFSVKRIRTNDTIFPNSCLIVNQLELEHNHCRKSHRRVMLEILVHTPWIYMGRAGHVLCMFFVSVPVAIQKIFGIWLRPHWVEWVLEVGWSGGYSQTQYRNAIFFWHKYTTTKLFSHCSHIWNDQWKNGGGGSRKYISELYMCT